MPRGDGQTGRADATSGGGAPAATAGASARRDAVDVARILALAVVVLGHLLLAVVDRADGELRGDNLIALHPGWAWLAAFAPMPVFFCAGGWANATAALPEAARRLRTLVGLGAVVVVGWSAAVVAVGIATGEPSDPGIVADGARIATQPLWFLAAYVPFVAAGRPLARLAARHVVLAVGTAVALLGALDAARFAYDAPDWVGYPGFFAAWGVPWLLGGWWRARCESGDGPFDERRHGAAMALGAAAAAALLVAFAGYAPALIDAAPGARSNTTPPTLYTAVAALGQVGLLIAGARALDRAGRRWRTLWDRAGEAAVGVYVWHLTALALVVALVAAGIPVPERLSAAWWLTRPLWWAAVLAVTALFVAVTAAARARLGRRAPPRPSPGLLRATAGAVLAAAGGAAVGLEGPQTSGLALLCSAWFVGGWWLLRGSTARVPVRDGPSHRGAHPDGVAS